MVKINQTTKFGWDIASSLHVVPALKAKCLSEQLFQNGCVIGAGTNLRETGGDPTAHAEVSPCAKLLKRPLVTGV